MTAPILHVDVFGTPKPQGSKRAFVIAGKGGAKARAIVTDVKGDELNDWRGLVANAARDAIPYDWTPHTGPVSVTVLYYLARPAGHYGSGRNAGILKASAPAYPITKPDVDKLDRAILDSLTSAGIYRDDSLVVSLRGFKMYADARRPGAAITVDAFAPPTPQTPVAARGLEGDPRAAAGSDPDDAPLFD